ncbi:MAG: hypothetical protein OXI60_11650 [Acidiferrobacterales bacterium]|nr:hypothetical protein [Acidiferrobacterales bacterium]
MEHLEFGDHIAKIEFDCRFAILFAVDLKKSFLTPPSRFALWHMEGAAPPQVRVAKFYRDTLPFAGVAVDRADTGYDADKSRWRCRASILTSLRLSG